MSRWSFGKEVGRGGYAVIKVVARESDGGLFAGKFLNRAWSRDPKAVKRFRHEVAIQQLLEHRHVMPIVVTNLKGPYPWFVMPLCKRSLEQEIAGGMKESRAQDVFRKILEAVSYAHGQEILHRDLKPQNVMVDNDDEPLVSDFGLGKNLASDSSAVTTTTIHAGSFVYASPEQLRDLRSADKRSDIYALGKILQAMVTGELPVQHDDPKVPRKYRHFIAKCTEPDPDKRYQSIEDVTSAFQQVLRGVEKPEAPREEFARLVSEWQALLPEDDLEALDKLHALLDRHSDNRGFYQEAVPQLPVELLEQYVLKRPSEFRRMLADFDGHVGGGLPFNYCDTVATFYERVLRLTDDLVVKRVVLARLLDMGRSHNRFFVGETTARALSSLRDESDVLLATEILREQPEDAAWCEEWTKDLAVAAPIREALREAKAANPT